MNKPLQWFKEKFKVHRMRCVPFHINCRKKSMNYRKDIRIKWKVWIRLSNSQLRKSYIFMCKMLLFLSLIIFSLTVLFDNMLSIKGRNFYLCPIYFTIFIHSDNILHPTPTHHRPLSPTIQHQPNSLYICFQNKKNKT